MDKMLKNEILEDYLAHHGILGQKWGVRRFQNKDGSLTSAGKKRRIEYDNGKGQTSLRGGGIGVRRYQNKDGTLTEEGKKRYKQDKLDNMGKKKENRIDTSEPNPKRWVQEDLTRQKDAFDAGSKLVKDIGDLEKKTRPKATPKKQDLSEMSDKELRDKINRKLLEQQYEKLYSDIDSSNVSKGREKMQQILETTGTVLGIASSAVGLAVAIQKMTKGGG